MARKKRSIVTTVAPQADSKDKPRYQDAFQQNVGKKFEEVGQTIGSHKRNLLYGLAGLVVLGIIAVIFFAWNARTTASAQAALAKAIETSEAPISSNPAPAGSTTKQFRTAKDRAQAAIPEFQLVIEQYGGPVAEKAKYFIAVNQLHLDRSVAVSELESLAKSSSEVGTLSKFALAQTRADDGRTDEAIALYKELLAMPDPIVSKESVSFELARLYEKQGNKPEAVSILFEMVKAASEKKDLQGKSVPLGSAAQAAKDKLKELDPEKAKEIPEPTPEPLDLNQLGIQ